MRSITPGDMVLDPFGGTGPILPAAHELKCKATYIEQDPVPYGIAAKRLAELK
jgi:DNA modification methylase